MDNKKLFKFLHKDISEIEELFAEKGTEGFDELEMEFIRTRFSGAKHIIQLLSEKDIPAQRVIVPNPIVKEESAEPVVKETESSVATQTTLSAAEQESLKSLSDFEEELKQEENSIESVKEEVEALQSEIEAEAVEESAVEEKEDEKEEQAPEVEDEKEQEITEGPEEQEEAKDKVEEAEEADEDEPKEVSNRIGDRAIKEKSVNDLLSGNDDKKLEYKISNSPVKSIQAAIGINDRYQYIRELFGGNAETFTKTVVDLDNLRDIQQAVSYLQENFKWKKTETSLKFVNLVKRRFPNG